MLSEAHAISCRVFWCAMLADTGANHMPSAHRRHAEWTPARLLREAEAIGPSTIALVERILAAKPHPEQGGGRQGSASKARGRSTGGFRAFSASCAWCGATAPSGWRNLEKVAVKAGATVRLKASPALKDGASLG